MKINRLMVAVLLVSVNAEAAIVNADWKTKGDNLITYDTSTNIQWLDITETVNRSYNDISSKFGVGGEFEGWRYASVYTITNFWNSFGGNFRNYDGWSTQNNGIAKEILSYWGDTFCSENNCNAGDGGTMALTANDGEFRHRQRGVSLSDSYINGQFIHAASSDFTDRYDYINSYGIQANDDFPVQYMGSALIRYGSPSPVPLPSTVWLFISGLVALISVVRRKHII